MFQYSSQCRFFFLLSLFSFSLSCILPLAVAFLFSSVSLSPYVYNLLAYAGLAGMATFWLAGKFGSQIATASKAPITAEELVTLQ